MNSFKYHILGTMLLSNLKLKQEASYVCVFLCV